MYIKCLGYTLEISAASDLYDIPSLPSKMPRTKNRNKDYKRGMENRQNGIFKKSFTFNEFYGGDIAVIIRPKNGKPCAYESSHGFIKSRLASLLKSLDDIYSSDHFETVANRSQRKQSDSAASEQPGHHEEGSISPPWLLSGISSTTSTSISVESRETNPTSPDHLNIFFPESLTPEKADIANYLDSSKDLNAEIEFVQFPEMESFGCDRREVVFPSTLLGSHETASSISGSSARLSTEASPTVPGECMIDPRLLIEGPRPVSQMQKEALIALANDCFAD
ncbi:hypothetical protein V8F33_008490 [Rhypophila sp. PSN 637]